MVDERGIALIGADGVWSTLRAQLQRAAAAALRATAPPGARWCRPTRCRRNSAQPLVHLWLGLDAHLVHYPVKAGRLINIVAIVHDEWNETGWSAAGERDEILRHFARWSWAEKARALIAMPDAMAEMGALRPQRRRSAAARGPVTLIGDAAHPMLPFLAQGAGMAIEDAAVLADMLGKYRDDPADALRGYEGARWHRTARAQQASRRQGRIYGLSGPEALVRNLAMRAMGGEKLLSALRLAL